MRRGLFSVGLTIGFAAGAFAQSTATAPPAGKSDSLHSRGEAATATGGYITGKDSGPDPRSFPWVDKLGPEEVIVPEPPEYVVRRAERLDAAWHELNGRLNKPVALEFADTPLRDAIAQLADQIETPVRIDEQSLTDEGVSIEDAVTIKAEGISAEEAFHQLLEPYGLAVAIDGESLVATTETMAEGILTIRVYPVADLVATNEGGKLYADFVQLIELISQATSGPWFEIDGIGGTMRPYVRGGSVALVVRTTGKVHREIEKLLFDLRRARPPEALEALLREPGAQTTRVNDATTERSAGLRQRLAPVVTEPLEAVRSEVEDISPAARELIEALRPDRERLSPSLRSRLEALEGRLREFREGEEVRPAEPQKETTVVVPIPPALRDNSRRPDR